MKLFWMGSQSCCIGLVFTSCYLPDYCQKEMGVIKDDRRLINSGNCFISNRVRVGVL